MIDWTELGLQSLWISGLSLILATLSDVAYVARLESVRLRFVIARRSHRRSMNVGVWLVGLGLLLRARTLWVQIAWVILLSCYSGWLCWHWLEARGRAQTVAGDDERELAGATSQSIPEGHKKPQERLAGWVELSVVGIAAPVLWFPAVRPQLMLLALGLVGLIWLAAALTGARLWPRSRYDLAVLVLLLAAGLSAFHSGRPDLTLPKVTALILGVAFYRAILRATPTQRSQITIVYMVFSLAIAFSLVGLIAGELREQKVPLVAGYRVRLPRFLEDLPDTEHGRVSTNQLGGALLYVLPLALSLALEPRATSSTSTRYGTVRLVSVVMTLLLAAALILSQSRAAWVGMMCGVLAFVALRWPWGKWVAFLLVIGAVAAFILFGGGSLLPGLALAYGPHGGDPASGVGGVGRLDTWAHVLSCIHGSPLIGCGLGTYRVFRAAHTHNALLQVAYDMGLLGLIAYLALLILVARMSWRLYRHGTGFDQALGIGSLSSLVAYHVYGLSDVVALGSKPGVLWWALLALIASADRLSDAEGCPAP